MARKVVRVWLWILFIGLITSSVAQEDEDDEQDAPLSIEMKTFGEVCSENSECDETRGLYCVEKICNCPTNETIFDSIKKICVGKVMENCVVSLNMTHCVTNAHCSHQDPQKLGLYFYEPRCFCDRSHFATPQGTCEPTAKYGEECHPLNKKCDELSHMICNNQTKLCECEFASDQFYDEDKGVCRASVGGRCLSYYSCTDNARCEGLQSIRARTYASASAQFNGQNSPNSHSDGHRGPPHARSVPSSEFNHIIPKVPLVVGKCVCEYSFNEVKVGNVTQCQAGFRQICTPTSKCAPGFQCIDSVCLCERGLSQHYDYSRKTCTSLINGKCSSRSDCVEFSDCVKGVCKCGEGYSKTPSRRCMVNFGNSCSKEKPCNSAGALICGTNSTCTCFDPSLQFNSEMNACLNEEGGLCGKIGHGNEYKEAFYVGCAKGLKCQAEVADPNISYCRQKRRLQDEV